MGDHQLMLKAALHYQGLVRVPCIWSDPTVADRPASSDVYCGTLDIASSVLERAGIAAFNGMQGKSLPAMATIGEGHDGMVIEEDQRRGYMGFDNNFRERTLVADSWRLTIYSQADWGELYDLSNDPCEFDNLWDDPAYVGKRAEMTERLARRMLDLADSSPLSTGHGP
jgi:arylsulfatase A-like enzyme